jgi:hypothetical protein
MNGIPKINELYIPSLPYHELGNLLSANSYKNRHTILFNLLIVE